MPQPVFAKLEGAFKDKIVGAPSIVSWVGNKETHFYSTTLSKANIASWGRLVETSKTCGTHEHMFIPSHVYVFTTSKISPNVQKWSFPLFLICLFPISWKNAISSHTISSITMICTTMKSNNISNRLLDGDMNFWYVASISLSQIPSWISCPPNLRWPLCFKLSMTFR